MTKQHFIALAAEIAKIEDPVARRSAARAVAAAAKGFNAAFDTFRFFTACGVALGTPVAV